MQCHVFPEADPRFARRGTPTPKLAVLCWPMFLKNCMKAKKTGPKGGGKSLAVPFGSTTVFKVTDCTLITLFVSFVIKKISNLTFCGIFLYVCVCISSNKRKKKASWKLIKTSDTSPCVIDWVWVMFVSCYVLKIAIKMPRNIIFDQI